MIIYCWLNFETQHRHFPPQKYDKLFFDGYIVLYRPAYRATFTLPPLIHKEEKRMLSNTLKLAWLLFAMLLGLLPHAQADFVGPPESGQAIIIAGTRLNGSLFPYSNEFTQRMYRLLKKRGYSDDHIHYVNIQAPDIELDGLPENERQDYNLFEPEQQLSQAFAQAAAKLSAGDQFVFYLHGHGRTNRVYISDYELSASHLRDLLATLPSGVEQIIILDTSYSGSFLDELAGVENRIVLTATDDKSLAWIVSSSSFSDKLLRNLEFGSNLFEAFKVAEDMILSEPELFYEQSPWLDDDGDGLYTSNDGMRASTVYLGLAGQPSVTIEMTVEALTISTTLQAGQALLLKSRTQGQIKRVWAEIEPIGMNFQITQQLELSQANEENVWETTWNNAFYNGDYQITFYAENPQGKIVNSEEPVTISVINGSNPPRQRLAIIVAGGGNHRTNSLWDDTESISNYIYYMLRDRKFTDDDIYYLTPETGADYDGNGTDDNIIDTPVRGRPLTDDDIRAAMDWAKERGTLGQPLYWFFTGHGSAAGPGRLQLAKLKYLKAPQLKELLDEYQNTTGNHTVLFIDACYSGVLVEQLKAPNRSIISSASANELAYFAEKQGFNRFIAKFLISGTNLFEAFNLARDEQHEMLGTQVQVADNGENITLYQNPQLDDNGDGIFNSHDGKWLENIHIGHKAESGRVIVEVEGITEPTILQVGQSLTLKAIADTDTGPAAQVWALIRPPRMNLVLDTNGTPILGFQRLNLSHTEDILWEGTWGDAIYNGDYEINFYAQDNEGNIASSDKSVIITVTGGVEPPQQANVQIVLEKDSYRAGEHFKAELIENLGWGYDLYVAVVLPDGNFIALKNTNEFAPLNQPKNWLKPRTQASPVTLLDLILPENLPTGQYCFYGILSPEKESVLETLPLWVWAQRCFEVF